MAGQKTKLEIGGSVGALLIGGEYHGQCIEVRIGLNGLPPCLEFPYAKPLEARWRDSPLIIPPEYGSARYVLYDDWPCRYLFEDDWGDDGDDGGDGPSPEDDPEPVVPDVLES